MEIELKLTVEEINAVLQTLGQMPTSSGIFPLLMKIKAQGDAQTGQQAVPTQGPTE